MRVYQQVRKSFQNLRSQGNDLGKGPEPETVVAKFQEGDTYCIAQTHKDPESQQCTYTAHYYDSNRNPIRRESGSFQEGREASGAQLNIEEPHQTDWGLSRKRITLRQNTKPIESKEAKKRGIAIANSTVEGDCKWAPETRKNLPELGIPEAQNSWAHLRDLDSDPNRDLDADPFITREALDGGEKALGMFGAVEGNLVLRRARLDENFDPLSYEKFERELGELRGAKHIVGEMTSENQWQETTTFRHHRLEGPWDNFTGRFPKFAD